MGNKLKISRKSKNNSPIILNVSEQFIFDLNKSINLNPPKFKYNLGNFYYLFGYIIHLNNQKKDLDWVTLNKDYLKSAIGSNFDRYIAYLKNAKLLMCDNKFEVNKKPYFYNIDIQYRIGKCLQIEITHDLKCHSKILNQLKQNRSQKYGYDPYLKSMCNYFMELNFDYIGAMNWIDNHAEDSKKIFYYDAIIRLKDHRFRYFKINKTNNRLDTNITNLKKDLRVFIVGDFVSIDLKNSQPFFLSQLLLNFKQIKDKNTAYTICPFFNDKELSKQFGYKAIRCLSKNYENIDNLKIEQLNTFAESVYKGKFYDDFVLQSNGKINREDIKTMMFSVLFSEKGKHSKTNEFIKTYPFIFNCVEILKNKGNSYLPIFLQKLESYIFIKCIANKLVEAGIIPITIHDSFLIEKKHEDKALEIIRSVFLEQFQVIPAFHVKNLK